MTEMGHLQQDELCRRNWAVSCLVFLREGGRLRNRTIMRSWVLFLDSVRSLPTPPPHSHNISLEVWSVANDKVVLVGSHSARGRDISAFTSRGTDRLLFALGRVMASGAIRLVMHLISIAAFLLADSTSTLPMPASSIVISGTSSLSRIYINSPLPRRLFPSLSTHPRLVSYHGLIPQ